MIVYLPNDDVASIVAFIKRATLLGVAPKPAEDDALQRMFKQIDAEKTGKPYQMWLKNEEERHADDIARSAPGVGRARRARGGGIRKSRPKKRG